MSVRELLEKNERRIREKFEVAYFQNEPQAVAVFPKSVEVFKKDDVYLNAGTNLGDPILLLYAQSMALTMRENWEKLLEEADICDKKLPDVLKV